MMAMNVMEGMRRFKIGAHERGFLFSGNEFQVILAPGRHWFFDPLFKIRVDVVSVRAAWLAHKDLDVIAKSGALEGLAKVLDLKDDERALVWIDGRFEAVLKPGLYALWTVFHDVQVQANTAKILETNPALMRLRELEVLDKVAAKANLQVMPTEKGLAERVVKLV